MTICSKNPAVFSVAKSYHEGGGLNVIPVRCDGSKSPVIRWRQYLHEKCPWNRIEGYFANDGQPVGIGIICGETSHNLVAFDWEGRAIVQYGQWLKQVRQVVAFLPVVITPSNGRHIYARLETAEAGEVLARNEAGEVLIETRGQNHYVIAPGSPLSTHRTGKPYLLIQGNLLDIPPISTRERDLLFDTARTFNRWEKPTTERKATAKPLGENRGLRAGDVFNATADWEDILSPHGWAIEGTRGDTTFWRKPGSRGNEHHATTGYGRDVFFCFSTSAYPFEAGQAYNKFACYALLNCHGDFSRAAREVANG